MSFVAKAVKKVFKGIGKIVKKAASFVKRAVKSKWFKVAALVAVSIFTAGVGSGLGFAAFNGVNTIGGFFSAVGTTMSAGWTAITTSIGGMFAGGGASTAAAGTQPLMTAGLNGTGGLLGTGAAAGTGAASMGASAASLGAVTATTANTTGVLMAGMGQVGAQVAQKGLLAKFGSLLMSNSVGGSMMRQGIIGGFNYMSQKDAAEKAEGYYRNRTVWGGPAYGGSAENTIQFPDFEPGGGEQFAYQDGPLTPQEEAQNAQQQMQQQQQAQQQGNMGQAPGTQQQYAAMQMPQQNQPPPQQRAQAPGLLQLENFGVA